MPLVYAEAEANQRTMNLDTVIFLGGPSLDAAVSVRCRDMALRLKCAYRLGCVAAADVPRRFTTFVCVKPVLNQVELAKLTKRGRVIWDVLDYLPPRQHVATYLVSTALAKVLLEDYGPIEHIPHHHCNFASRFNDPALRTPAWIGSRHWRPELSGFHHELYFTDGLRQPLVAQIFRKIGIGLNFRGSRATRQLVRRHARTSSAARVSRLARTAIDLHVALNSGIKVINCIGFGIPSVSCFEPAYAETGEACTIFSSGKKCGEHVRALQEDELLYRRLRRACIRRAAEFHIDAIAEQYKRLLRTS